MQAMEWDTHFRKGETRSALQESVWWHLRYSTGKPWAERSPRSLYLALAYAVRDRLMDRLLETEAHYEALDAKRLYYLSIEFLIGRSLSNNLHNLGLYETLHEALKEMGVDLEEVKEQENDAALGNGGLGRLAACFLDSLATLDMPGFGYGIHYEYGLFRQGIDDGYQKEKLDHWLAEAMPLQMERPDQSCLIPLYGRVAHERDLQGNYNPMWLDWKVVVGVPYDIPIVGYGGRTVNYLRLYAARSSSELDIQIFNEGDYVRAVEQKIAVENISKILYPSDTVQTGRELRLVQEYFLVACALRDIIRRYRKSHKDFDAFPDKVAIQLNDTHPALTVAELMRMLVDEYAVDWDRAWDITQRVCGYTNHTLLPEALEKWPVSLLERVLPRHLQIVYEINHRFLEEISVLWPGDTDRLRRMSLIEEEPEKQVRMAHLAIVGSHSINGVSALHTELLKKTVVRDFHERWPGRFNNKTNGITQRRWLLTANPSLAELLGRTVGMDWVTQLTTLRGLESMAGDPDFQRDFLDVKHRNKERLADMVMDTTRVRLDPGTLFDIHAKRIHEYKRQLLKVMHIIHEYLTLVEDGRTPPTPRSFLFAGKAAPGYWAAKQIIKLIHSVADVVNRDRRVKDWLRVVFIPDYRVSLAERIIPAADVNEQISMAGTEASGTGNMKFVLNGSLIVGTLDGANIEILEAVGRENAYIFGLTADEITTLRREDRYHPREVYQGHDGVRRVMDALLENRFSPSDPGLFRWIVNALLDGGDHYMHLADFPSYIEIQDRVARDFADTSGWACKAILNVARVGWFSSDRTIEAYAGEVWKIQGTSSRKEVAAF